MVSQFNSPVMKKSLSDRAKRHFNKRSYLGLSLMGLNGDRIIAC
jgi:hypothetical protein